jgi:aspartate/methionine/tyrosine aminotransferase
MRGISRRVTEIPSEASFFVLKMARDLEVQGRDVVHMEIGEPGFDTPKKIKDAAVEALRNGDTHYTPSQGASNLREAIAERVRDEYGVEVNFDRRVAVTVGAKQAIHAVITAVVEPGDEVICPNPGYPAYDGSTLLAGGRPVYLRLEEEEGFRAKPEALAKLINERTKLVVLNFPENPCGSTLAEEDLKGILELAEDHDLYILSDEIYKYIVYDGARHVSPFRHLPDRTFLVDGFSKAYAMTGWRLGYVVAPEEAFEPVVKVINVTTSCPSSFSQSGALAAFSCYEEVREMVREYELRRNFLHDRLSRLDHVKPFKPEGTFYMFVNVKEILDRVGMNSEELTKHLLQKYGLAVLHGSSFGEYGEGYLRMSFARPLDEISKGVERFANFVENPP